VAPNRRQAQRTAIRIRFFMMVSYLKLSSSGFQCVCAGPARRINTGVWCWWTHPRYRTVATNARSAKRMKLIRAVNRNFRNFILVASLEIVGNLVMVIRW
jgi:hypothetical protein